jgi:multiple sugar transport system substrate-binding protein
MLAKKRRRRMAGSIYRLFEDKLSDPLSTRKRSRITRLSLVGLTVFVAVVVVYCAQPDVPATVIYGSYWYGQGSARAKVDRELVEQFQEAYPHIEVEYRIVGADALYLTHESPFDVLSWDGEALYPSAEHRDLFTDIDDLWKQEGWEQVIPESLQEVSQSNGRYVFLPTHCFWTAFYYNKALFEQFDLTPPETWDEFLEVCATLKQNDITPIAIGLGQAHGWQALVWLDYLNLRINGLEFRNELMSEGQIPFNDPRVREPFATFQALAEEGYFIEGYRSLSNRGSFEPVLDGEAAMVLASAPHLLETIPEARLDELGFFRFPVINPDVPIAEAPGIEGFIIPANAPDPQAAMKFLAYRGSAEAQDYWGEGCGPVGGIPVRTDVDSAALTPAMQPAQEMLQNADELSQQIIWLRSPMIDVMMARFGSWLNDLGTLDDFLDRVEARRQEAFEE